MSRRADRLPYLANLLANLAFRTNVDRSAGHWAIRTAENLRWTQYVSLRLVAGPVAGDLPDPVAGRNAGTWESWTAHEDLIDLGADRRDLIQPREQTGWRTIPRPPARLTEFELTSGGRLLSELVDLDQMPLSDVVVLPCVPSTSRQLARTCSTDGSSYDLVRDSGRWREGLTQT